MMFLLNFKKKQFWSPADGFNECNQANIRRMLDDHEGGKLTESKLII